MKFNNAVNFKALATAACCLLLLSACATEAITERDIETRAMDRWNTLLSGDLAGAYEFLSPGYRSSVSSMQYQRSLLAMKVKWNKAEFIESNCEEVTCNVKILLHFVIYGALPGVRSFEESQFITESWVKVDGNWYFVPPK
jgi:hypothetical protein